MDDASHVSTPRKTRKPRLASTLPPRLRVNTPVMMKEFPTPRVIGTLGGRHALSGAHRPLAPQDSRAALTATPSHPRPTRCRARRMDFFHSRPRRPPFASRRTARGSASCQRAHCPARRRILRRLTSRRRLSGTTDGDDNHNGFPTGGKPTKVDIHRGFQKRNKAGPYMGYNSRAPRATTL